MGVLVGSIGGILGTSIALCGSLSEINLDKPLVVNSVSSNDKNSWKIDMDFSIVDLRVFEQPNLRPGDKVKFVLKKVENDSK